MRSGLALVVHLNIGPHCLGPSKESGPRGTVRPFGSGPASWGQMPGLLCSLPLDEQPLFWHRPPTSHLLYKHRLLFDTCDRLFIYATYLFKEIHLKP